MTRNSRFSESGHTRKLIKKSEAVRVSTECRCSPQKTFLSRLQSALQGTRRATSRCLALDASRVCLHAWSVKTPLIVLCPGIVRILRPYGLKTTATQNHEASRSRAAAPALLLSFSRPLRPSQGYRGAYPSTYVFQLGVGVVRILHGCQLPGDV